MIQSVLLALSGGSPTTPTSVPDPRGFLESLSELGSTLVRFLSELGGLFAIVCKKLVGKTDPDLLSIVGAVLGLVALLALILWVPRQLLPSYRLLRYTIYRFPEYSGWRGAWWIVWELLRLLLIILKTFSLVKATRLRIEVELLRPFEAGEQLPGSFSSRLKARWNYHGRRSYWKRDLRRDLYSVAANYGKEEAMRLVVNNCFLLHQQSEEIVQYLRAVQAFDPVQIPGTPVRFLSRVVILDGFLAPLHLTAGLLSKFDEDWTRLIGDFDREHQQTPAGHWRRQRSFFFNCWLQWGPSIPVCTCGQWSGALVLQYGYGDEANSVPVIVRDEASAAVLETLKKDPTLTGKAREVADASSAARRPIAVRRALAATPVLGSSISSAALPKALEMISEPGIQDLVLEHHFDFAPGGMQGANQYGYYSAYVWVMFLVDEKSSPGICPDDAAAEGDLFRRLLPFFEHANIADPNVYELLKARLARKAVASIDQILREHARATGRAAEAGAGRDPGNLTIYYLCAFDDPNCSDSSLLVPPPGQRIRDFIEEELKKRDFRALKQIVHMDERCVPGSSCHLPEEIKKLYARLDVDDDASRATCPS